MRPNASESGNISKPPKIVPQSKLRKSSLEELTSRYQYSTNETMCSHFKILISQPQKKIKQSKKQLQQKTDSLVRGTFARLPREKPITEKVIAKLRSLA